MKIGILTQPIGRNYGGILQNWALQQILIREGHQPVTITHQGEIRKHKFLFDIRDVAAYCVKHIIHHPTRRENKLPWDHSPFKRLRGFAKKHIKQTRYMPVINAHLLKEHNITTLIIGSDQTWRPKYNGQYLNLMYADFLMDNSINTFSYAASFGTGTWEYPEEQTLMVRKAIKKFKAISVREKSGVNLCKKYLGREAIHVLDPTLLLNESDYKELIPKKIFSCLPPDYVAVYILDLTDEKKAIVNDICNKLGLTPLYFGNTESDGKNLVSVEYWLAALMKSSFVITDSFHGTVFSINFHKPFISLINHNRGADRFNSVLELFNMKKRSRDIVEGELTISDILKDNIDWSDVDIILDKARKDSLKYLKDNLLN